MFQMPFRSGYYTTMLVTFAVRNHRSLHERAVLSMEATSDEHLAESRVISADGLRLLRSVALYGPNASGKSNVLDALRIMRNLVTASTASVTVNRPIPVEPFRLSSVAADEPSEFQVEFLLDGARYRYGFVADSKAVHAEWLKRKGKGKEATLFERERQDIESNPDFFPEGRERKQFVLPNALFLPLCAALNGEVSGKILGWFQKLRVVSGLNDAGSLYETAMRILKEPTQKAQVEAFAKRADLQISGLDAKEFQPSELNLPHDMPDAVRQAFLRRMAIHETEIKTRHVQFDPDGKEVGTVEFDLKTEESEGTKKFVGLSGPFHEAVNDGAVLVVDEFDARLHPLLTQAIMEWFHGPQNTSRAQLIIATHDVLLMDPDRIRRDQVWFCDKDEKGATHLYSLAEFDPKEVRPTTQFGRQYLLGLFGAVPHPSLLKAEPSQPEQNNHV